MAATTTMRIFLVQTAQGLTPSSGGYKANISLLRELRSFGHVAAQICYGFEHEVEQYAERAAAKGIDPDVTESTVPFVDFRGAKNNLLVKTFFDEYEIQHIVISRSLFKKDYPRKELWQETKDYIETGEASDLVKALVNLYTASITEFRPTHVVFNDAMTMKIASLHPDRAKFKRVVVVHTAEQLPFGPYCSGLPGHCMSAEKEDVMLRDVDGIWVVSRAIHDYALKYGNLETKFLNHSTMTYLDSKTGGIPERRRNENKDDVGLINPCPYKGLAILVALAKKLPHVNFVTWASWGSKPEHKELLQSLPNVKIEDTTSDTDKIWDRIKILLAPSVWYEAWGIVVTEAQLRGIPVIASEAGGLREAKLGLDYCIPVNLVTGEKDANGEYIIPDQDITPWESAIVELMTDKTKYRDLSSNTWRTASKWFSGLDTRAQEKWFLDMMEANDPKSEG
ncbi:UDP-Glycosyltransferase/glycogen phosphorylase [Lasiosphaeria ovina]|uniref:UDP-Glycosyltransferase/glycogen phosphorylase n=1 Tax=Lasiosphaeria ovina TaxID=92902 RepID=A0AAE0JTG2_9PEZI|nr:UDP-Glycosyltransferase/glycogen phosphorylase [Lasiosphaeria ovina]